MTKTDAPAVRFPPPLLYLGLLLGGPLIERLTGMPPAGLPWKIGIAVGLGGLAMILAAQMRFRAAGENPVPWTPTGSIIDSGIYSVTRNPMYLGMTVALFGFGVALDSIVALVFVPLAVIIIDRQVIAREEAYLTRTLGRAYVDYCRRVPRWL